MISIHALFAEGDISGATQEVVLHDFYPRPLRRGRRQTMGESMLESVFLSTPSSQRATSSLSISSKEGAISIHALFAEGDPTSGAILYNLMQFLSTPSSQRATAPCRRTQQVHSDFYPRPLRRGRRFLSGFSKPLRKPFLSTPSSQRATCLPDAFPQSK